MQPGPDQHLLYGAPAPEFLLPPLDGVPATFYERYCGRPAVVVLAAQVEQLSRFAALSGSVGLMGIVPGAGGEALAADIPALGDDGRLARAFGEAPDQSGPVAWVLDPTLRLIRRIESPDLSRLTLALEGLASPTGAAETLSVTAPVLMLPGVLNPDLCQRLIAAHEGDHRESGMMRLVNGAPALVPDHGVKRRLDHLLTDTDLVAQVSQALSSRVLPMVATAFNYRVTHYEPCKVVAYHAATGGYFRRHRDNLTPDARHRRFALSINLNDDYQGGGLSFPEFGPQAYRAPRGGAMVFSGGLLHEATDVSLGTRYVLLSFLWGDETLK